MQRQAHFRMLIIAAACAAVQTPRAMSAQSFGPRVHPDSAHSVLIGRVLDTAGTGLAGAEITGGGSDSVHAITNDSGGFRIEGLHPGPNSFAVRRLGFERTMFSAVLKPGATQRARLTLASVPVALPTVAVSDTAPKSHWLDQFNTRKAMHRGTFIDRAAFEKWSPRFGSEIVRHVAGVSLVPTRRGGNQVVFTRTSTRQCFPTMYVHGTPFSGQIDDLPVDDIEAVEVYVGVSEIPPELDKGGHNICGVINVWTRDPSTSP